MKLAQLIRPGLVVSALVALAACGSQTTPATGSVGEVGSESQTRVVAVDGGTYTDVTVDGLSSMLDNKDFAFVNVHIPYAGEIADTDAFIPFDQVAQNLADLPADKDAKIVLYCRSGAMSAISAPELVELGYTDVWNLEGGMNEWVASGRTLLQLGS